MPFSYRKSVNIGGGVRMTVSKSGVSTSIGGKGYRLTTGPKGTYITIGRGGIQYRQKIGGYVGHNDASTSPPFQQRAPTSYQTGTPILTADASQFVELSSASTLDQLNATAKQPAYAWIFVVVGGILGLLLAQIHIVLLLLSVGLGLYVGSIAHKLDRDRRTFRLEYKFDIESQHKWNELGQAVATLGRTQRLWRITTLDKNYDWKRNAGASSILTRTNAVLKQSTSSTISTNVAPTCLDIGYQKLYFFPDRLYVLQNGTYGAIEYASMALGSGTTRFIEDQGVPGDSQTVGQTWRFVNKDGGPDRRFNDNRQIPIALYGVAELKSLTGLNILLHVSSVTVAEQFVNLFRAFQVSHQNAGPQKSPGFAPNFQPSDNTSSKPPPRNADQNRPAAPKIPQNSLTSCLTILGLTTTCTKEEALTRYRQQVMQYHPNRVSHLAPEFQELATKKIKELNIAYMELKRIRGW